jgi:hypothetical protein
MGRHPFSPCYMSSTELFSESPYSLETAQSYRWWYRVPCVQDGHWLGMYRGWVRIIIATLSRVQDQISADVPHVVKRWIRVTLFAHFTCISASCRCSLWSLICIGVPCMTRYHVDLLPFCRKDGLTSYIQRQSGGGQISIIHVSGRWRTFRITYFRVLQIGPAKIHVLLDVYCNSVH